MFWHSAQWIGQAEPCADPVWTDGAVPVLSGGALSLFSDAGQSMLSFMYTDVRVVKMYA